jgi:2-keto-4-pentenoate hydratase/2-oxohepta-3-ene-1,7-dioic acid hydratase in catechol pathway
MPFRKGNVVTTKYQLGSGAVDQKTRMIVYVQNTHFDLSAALHDSSVNKLLSLEHNELPEALLNMMQQWKYWNKTLPQVVEYLERDGDKYQLDTSVIRWLPPLQYPNKLICLGANYKDHNQEMGNTTRDKYPFTFLKPPTTALVGAGETVRLPEYAKMIDWEVELAVVIGEKTRNVHGDDVMKSIAGYSILNDISARDWVPREEQSFMGFDWIMLKGFDGSAPMGPYITPAEFVPDPQTLNLSLTLNGEIKQNANTASMVFTVHEIIEHLSRVLTLEPGDVIATGTPSGVGYGRKPPEFLHSGDRMIATVEGLGSLETTLQ